MTTDNLVEIRGLKVYFEVRGGILKRTTGWVKAVDGVDLDIGRGEILGFVSESGCGKTTVGRAILRLIPATEGSVRLRQAFYLEYC
jgi:ABC-type oligopeptide transport system ATPase subunit